MLAGAVSFLAARLSRSAATLEDPPVTEIDPTELGASEHALTADECAATA